MLAALLVAFVTVAAMAGAVAGVVAAGAGFWLRHLLPFSGGLLLGMSILMMAPEAFAHGPAVSVTLAFALGFVALNVVERVLHATRPAPHQTWAGVIPVATAMAIHSMLDGWNTLVAISASPAGAWAGAWAFAGAMALHKLTGGFAVGAVIRAAAPKRGGAVAIAAAVELATVIGALFYIALRRLQTETWTHWLLAATAGSLLYIAFHTLRRAAGGASRSVLASGAATGLVTIWLFSLLAR